MKYTTDQLELIAIMFRTQFADKTLVEVFPEVFRGNGYNIKIFNIKIGELGILRGRLLFERDVDLIDEKIGGWLISFRYGFEYMVFNKQDAPTVLIDDIVKMLNFEDKIGET